MSRQLRDNPFEPQLPSWLRDDVPLHIDRDVIPLICGLDYLPENWARRKHLGEPSVKSVRIPVKGAPPFPSPHWTGDAPPTGVWVNQTINLPSYPETSQVDKNVLSNNPPKDFWIYLVRDLGFPIEAAITSFGIAPGIQTPDRRRRSAVRNEEGDADDFDAHDHYIYEGTVLPQPGHVYLPVPIRHTKVGGGFTRASVLKAIARMRIGDKMKLGLEEVVYRRQPPSKISRKYRVNLETLKKYATRLRQCVRAGTENSEKAKKIEGFEDELSTILT